MLSRTRLLVVLIFVGCLVLWSCGNNQNTYVLSGTVSVSQNTECGGPGQSLRDSVTVRSRLVLKQGDSRQMMQRIGLDANGSGKFTLAVTVDTTLTNQSFWDRPELVQNICPPVICSTPDSTVVMCRVLPGDSIKNVPVAGDTSKVAAKYICSCPG